MKPDFDLGRQIVSELDRVPRPKDAAYLPRYRRASRPWFRVPGTMATGLVATGLAVLALTMTTTTGSTNPSVWGLRLSSMVEETGNWGAPSASSEPSPSPSDQPATPRGGGDPAPPRATVPALAPVKSETPKPHEAVSEPRKQPSPSPGSDGRPVRSSPSPSASPSPQRSASPSPEPSDSPQPSPEPSHSPDSAR